MWLLAAAVRQAMQDAYTYGGAPSASERAQFAARYDEGGGPAILTVAGDVAEITVSGVITKAPDLMSMLFGGGNTTYREIVSALSEAQSDPAVKRAELAIDSPGGSVDGLFEALAAVEAFDKPLKAVVRNQAASAAYALASQADTIEVADRATRVGSVGVAVSLRTPEDVHTITSSEAPRKRPDPRTSEGLAMIREELDAMHQIFVEAIAGGRGVTVDAVNAEYGQGAVLLADEALKRGMIDSIAKAPLRVVKSGRTSKPTATAQRGGEPETGPMDLKELKAQHPDAYAAALQEGITHERERVTAHMTMGEASGDMQTAVAAITEGAAMTPSLQAKYWAAGMNRKDKGDRAADDAAAAAADGAHSDASTPDAAAEAVCRIVEGSADHFAQE